MALSTTTPTQVSTSNWNFTEPSGGSYTRVSVANDGTHWGAVGMEPSNGYSVWNELTISWPQASGSWGTVTYVGLWDASSSGNLWAFGELENSFIVQPSSIVSFPANTLTITNN